MNDKIILPKSEWDAYRLGDIYWHEWKQLNRTKSKYPDTIGAAYILDKTKRHDIDTMATIVNDKCGVCKDEIAVHLRVGDAVCKKGWQEESRRPPDSEQVIDAVSDIYKLAVRSGSTGDSDPAFFTESPNITIYFGAHTSACEKESEEYVNYIKESLENKFDNVSFSRDAELVSNSENIADQDFCGMCGAKIFIQGKGGYSELISEVRSFNGMHDEQIGKEFSNTINMSDLTRYNHMGRGWTS